MIAKPSLKFDINFMFIDSIFFADKFYKFKLDVSEFADMIVEPSLKLNQALLYVFPT
jgi:hypothetical protein